MCATFERDSLTKLSDVEPFRLRGARRLSRRAAAAVLLMNLARHPVGFRQSTERTLRVKNARLYHVIASLVAIAMLLSFMILSESTKAYADEASNTDQGARSNPSTSRDSAHDKIVIDATKLEKTKASQMIRN